MAQQGVCWEKGKIRVGRGRGRKKKLGDVVSDSAHDRLTAVDGA
jgi:hypothetical protein